MGIRVSARIEQRATPITRTTTEMGLRRALRRSHMAISLLAPHRAATAKTGRGRPERPRPTRDSAKPRAVREHHRSLLAPENSARRKHPQASRGQLDTVHSPGFPLFGLLPIRAACSRRLSSLHRARPGPCGVVLSDLAKPGRSALSLRVRLPLPHPFSTWSKRCRMLGMSPSARLPSSRDPAPTPLYLPEICPLGQPRFRVPSPPIANTASGNTTDQERARATATLGRARAELPQLDLRR